MEARWAELRVGERLRQVGDWRRGVKRAARKRASLLPVKEAKRSGDVGIEGSKIHCTVSSSAEMQESAAASCLQRQAAESGDT